MAASRWRTQTPPQVDQGKSITQAGFKITTHKLPISRAGPIEEMTERLGITPPEMIFGDNSISIEHMQSGWSINFNSFDALDRVDKKGSSMLKVAHSKEWQQTREHVHEDIKEVIKPFDWSYSTDYMGTTSSAPELTPSQKAIPIGLLTRPDPILFFDEVMLYEDELADNGIAMLSCKIRVMPERLLLLSRFFLRLDGVLFRIRDTRVFVEFETGEVIREYTAREEKYETIKSKLSYLKDEVTTVMRDPNKLAELMPVVEKKLDSLILSSGHS
ncbi:uncharacterized protein PV09_03108 [Verruconis gallopava]|uniref:TIP41-like protein n=1 Tax=Verruconis gallopava TaxID=253628 RepID=A0A0D2AH80_9PEZI|nr:uncharacterized protein PV09_03108 [Verruconis gallopava]KIW05915.1 hypothetical protein PV09_03108 [Verruconis gallopava]